MSLPVNWENAFFSDARAAEVHADSSVGIPEKETIDAIIGKTGDFENFLQDISRRADLVRKGCIYRQDDNMLKITSDGRKAALDMRLVDSTAVFTFQSKVARCAENVFYVYTQTNAERSTQLVFCNTSTPKDSFNLYDELKNLLVGMGIGSNEIAFVHDAKTEQDRTKLFASMRSGDVRVLVEPHVPNKPLASEHGGVSKRHKSI